MATSIGRSWYVPGSMAKRFYGSYAQLANRKAKQDQMNLLSNAANVMFGAMASQAKLSSMFAATAAAKRGVQSTLDVLA